MAAWARSSAVPLGQFAAEALRRVPRLLELVLHVVKPLNQLLARGHPRIALLGHLSRHGTPCSIFGIAACIMLLPLLQRRQVYLVALPPSLRAR